MYRYGYNAMGKGMGTGTSPACQEVTGTGPRPYLWYRYKLLYMD